MKQTAVKWLVDYCDKEVGYIPIEIIEQAKAMEKEQIIEAFEHIDFNLDDGLHYYTETYESNTRI